MTLQRKYYNFRGAVVRMYHLPKTGFPLVMYVGDIQYVSSRVVRVLKAQNTYYAQTDGGVYPLEEIECPTYRPAK